MVAQMNDFNGDHGVMKLDYDAIVVGAGFAGLRIIVELRKLGLMFKVLEEGNGVGGTWYWNRYPGARTDSESWIYILNLSKELNDAWTWKERFPCQPEVLAYLNHVVDRFDMRKDIRFNTRVKSATWDDSRSLWNIKSIQNEYFTCRYLICATGALSVGRELPFPGVDKFRGESYTANTWPQHAVDFKGKRVGIIGTGATSVQIVPTVAHSAASVTVFQRTPNYVLPARNHPLTSDHQDQIKRNYDAVWQGARNQMFGMVLEDSKLTINDMKNDAAIQRVLERGWEVGGLGYIFETFADLTTNEAANHVASEFVRNKIRAIVKDEETAELLCPDHPIMAKRPPLGHFYFETYNKPHVTLVDVKSNPIKEITETSIRLTEKDHRTEEDEFELDMIIYAVGFDVSTGPLTRLEVRGINNGTLSEHWNKHLETYLGIMVGKFPNMFMMAGPQIPFANFPVILDNTADWIGHCISHMQANGYKVIEPKRKAMDQWGKLLNDVFQATVLAGAAEKAGSWYVGANVPGKPVCPLFWFGGVPSYIASCDAELKAGFPSLKMS